MEKKNEKAATVCFVAFLADARSGDGAKRLRWNMEGGRENGSVPEET
jgi:hypothetical protein